MITDRTAVVGMGDGAVGDGPETKIRMPEFNALIQNRDNYIWVAFADGPGAWGIDSL